MTRQDCINKYPQYTGKDWCIQAVGDGFGYWHWRALYVGGTFLERHSVKLSQTFSEKQP
jgi:hypothetical protein